MLKSMTVIILLIIIINGEFLEEHNDENSHLARKKKFKFPYYGLFYGFGFHTLAILYWIKVKVIIAILIIGAAIFWGVRQIWSYKSCIDHEHTPIISGPFISDHGHDIHHDFESFSPHSVDSLPQGLLIKDFDHHHNHDNRKIWKAK